jgi:hypothetical protein
VSLGAAPASTLATLLDALAPGGHFGFSYNDATLADPAYMEALDRRPGPRRRSCMTPTAPSARQGDGLPRLCPAQALSAMITRFAPSPTGPLHLGHAYSAILAHDMARAAGGTFLLRIEDIDQSRARPEWETLIHEDLRWLGLTGRNR